MSTPAAVTTTIAPSPMFQSADLRLAHVNISELPNPRAQAATTTIAIGIIGFAPVTTLPAARAHYLEARFYHRILRALGRSPAARLTVRFGNRIIALPYRVRNPRNRFAGSSEMTE